MVNQPDVIVEAFAINGNKNIIPVPSQISSDPGAASFNDGFPPLTMTPLVEGGIPPDGFDVNGILFMATAYCAWLQGGGGFYFDQDFSDANTGYAIGAILRSVSDPTLWFESKIDNNEDDPDATPTNWKAFRPATGGATGVQTATLGAGTTVSVTLNPGIGFLDITANAAGSTLQSILGGYDGQQIIVTEVGSAGNLTLAANAGTSGGQLRLPVDLTYSQNMGQSFKFSSTLNKWIPL